MRRLLLGLLMAFITQSAWAQSSGNSATVEGTVYDQQGNTVPNASVAIYDSTQSNLLTGTTSDTTGVFSIRVQPGSYVLQVSYVSYQDYTEPLDLTADETQNVGEITLQQNQNQMNEVMVRGEESRMEMNFDSRTFDVGQDITSMGGSALDVLDNVPSIATDIDGNLSLRGNQSVRILINGRPSNLVEDGADALRSIPAYLIQDVEIITNPSAKFSAQGSAGIINIIMKKDQRRGFNGSVGAGSGLPQNHEVSTNLNYRTEHVNWFMGGGADYRSDPEDGYSYQEYIPQNASADTAYAYRENTESNENEIDGDLRLGADFFLTDRQTLTIDANGQLEDGWNDETVTYTDYFVDDGSVGDVMRRIERTDEQDGMEKELEANLEYENRIQGQDHRLTAEASFEVENESEMSNFNETVLESTGNYNPERERSSGEESSQDVRFEADYVRPLGETGELEVGARSTFDWNDNTQSVERLRNGTWQPVQGAVFNNNFRYNENINAAYATLSKEFGDFSTSVGLRMEHTAIETELKTSGARTRQNYVDLFPSVFLNYSFNEQQSVQVSYSRRLDRPWSRALLPFSDYSDSRSRFLGNPNLKPEYANSYEAGYLQYWGSGSLLTSVYYRYRTGVEEDITTLDDEGIRRTQPINLATEEAWGIEFSADQDITDGLSITANANFYRSDSRGTYEGDLLTSEDQTMQGRMTLRWRPTDNWNMQLSSRYYGPENTTQGSEDGMTMMDTGISHNFELWDGQATLTFNVEDLLNSQNFQQTINNPNFYSEREFSWSSRSVMISFRYQFNQFGQKQERGGRGGGDWD